ncbi:hypothetical protein [Prochlorococcus sp. MIT 1307]|uniref:hypothetical protein n=1 Tax=Prochlorococcus sp. MIT 1307 TaxID=3096219 RepID=UPI002A75ED3F|nr:hypothetical protein [Prochlorococcus sp. MIT 1307]
MFRKEEKKSLTRLALLSVGWGLGLDRFYDGQTRDGLLSIIGWLVIFGSLMLLSPCHGYDYSTGGKTMAEMSVNPLIIVPFGFGLYGAVLVVRKGFRLLRQFETAE